jgi:hypothetical protein
MCIRWVCLCALEVLEYIELYGSEIQPDQPGISTARAAENHQEGLAMDEFV